MSDGKMAWRPDSFSTSLVAMDITYYCISQIQSNFQFITTDKLNLHTFSVQLNGAILTTTGLIRFLIVFIGMYTSYWIQIWQWQYINLEKFFEKIDSDSISARYLECWFPFYTDYLVAVINRAILQVLRNLWLRVCANRERERRGYNHIHVGEESSKFAWRQNILMLDGNCGLPYISLLPHKYSSKTLYTRESSTDEKILILKLKSFQTFPVKMFKIKVVDWYTEFQHKWYAHLSKNKPTLIGSVKPMEFSKKYFQIYLFIY